MKTAVSIPRDLVARIDRLARTSHRSRSEVVSAAVREYLANHQPDEVTAAPDRVLSEAGPSAEDRFVKAAARRTLAASELLDRWRDVPAVDGEGLRRDVDPVVDPGL